MSCIKQGRDLYQMQSIFYFSFIAESSSEMVEGVYGNTNSRLIYGVFTTAPNAIAGSAVCAFSLQVSDA
jgi:semaphorin 6